MVMGIRTAKFENHMQKKIEEVREKAFKVRHFVCA